jgi:hypothetical protein
MTDKPQFARTCRYAAPTLFLQWPYWLDAWSWPWSCTKGGRLRLMQTAAGCKHCPRWELREAGAEPLPFDTLQPIVKD